MRPLTPLETDNIKQLTENSVELTLIEPTATGLEKSIMDATAVVRVYLKEQGVHNYELQGQGGLNKVIVDSRIVLGNQVVNSRASLYRPETKKGDPRIWFSGLNNVANPNDILAITAFDGKLYVLNITQLNIANLLTSGLVNPVKDLVEAIKAESSSIADELLELLKGIAAQGMLPADVAGDTAIGRTLETLLGIPINSSKSPDYKGIELKAHRAGRQQSRVNLFAQIPDWTLSKFKSSAEILNAFGYARGEDFKLYCTVSTLVANSQGLKLRINNTLNQLIETSTTTSIGDFAVWALEKLHDRLLEKHNETFWVTAETKHIGGIEHFHYKSVHHTRKPIVSQFDILLQQGIITLDHLIKRDKNNRVVEKGPLFKLRPNSVSLLFPPSQNYDLLR